VIDKSNIDPNALHYYRLLKDAGFSAYFVGGSVRDLLLGKHPKDFDIATNATPHQIKRVIPQGRIIGRRFRHVMLERGGGRYEIVTFRGPVIPAEVSSMDEGSESEGTDEIDSPENEISNTAIPSRDRKFPDLNQFGNAEQDALRRDFTINALFYDPDSDELVDYVEGKLDVDRKIVRSIGDPQVRMEEDPIRILRAIRHKMKLGLDYDPALENAMKEKSNLLVETSKDRIREEFLKVCNDHSLGDFLSESRRLGLSPFILPWYEGLSEEVIQENFRLLEKFKGEATPERLSADMGLALMMIPLIEPQVLEPYKQTLKQGDKNHLPDMKYFLSCETLRNFYLRNLRISRAQTDHLVRALFYFSRMTGLWLDQGPPRRIIGRLFQHPPAVLAAKMAKLNLELLEKPTPDWMMDLANYDSSKKRRFREELRSGPQEVGSEPSEDLENNDSNPEAGESSPGPVSRRNDRDSMPVPRDRETREREPAKPSRLPPPDKPMVWNGPLHAPVLRPNFTEEAAIRWARKNQTIQAFRPSGIPNQPVDHSLQKKNLVYNYKPELETQEKSEDHDFRGNSSGGRERENHRHNKRGRDRNRGRGPHQRNRSERDQETSSRPMQASDDQEEFRSNSEPMDSIGPAPRDEDSYGNVRLPGERPAALSNSYDGDYEDDIDDNIGNRLDGPPTSGHVGVNGDGLLTHQQSRQHNGQRRPGGFSGGGNRDGGQARRKGKRRGRRTGGPNRGGPPRGHQNNP
jgi:poly(A) polymerase